MGGKITDTDDDDKVLERQQEQSKEKQDELQELRKKVKDLEEKVEKKDIADSWKQEHYKSSGATLVLSLGVGIVLLGIGHFYLGKRMSGTVWLICGLLLSGLMVFLSMSSGGNAVFGFIIVYFILWIFQGVSAANYCKKWNKGVSKGIILW